jgi:hypothetical protein
MQVRNLAKKGSPQRQRKYAERTAGISHEEGLRISAYSVIVWLLFSFFWDSRTLT